MRYYMLLLGTVSAFSTIVAQKDSSAIYATAEDFQNQKLSYDINYKIGKHKFKDNMLFQNAKHQVVHEGQTYTMDKDSTNGFKNTKSDAYRFINRQEYKVLNAGKNILPYVYTHLGHGPKEESKYVPLYFFSTDASSLPLSLTKANLKTAYPENHPFHDALDAQFKDDGNLYA